LTVLFFNINGFIATTSICMMYHCVSPEKSSDNSHPKPINLHTDNQGCIVMCI